MSFFRYKRSKGEIDLNNLPQHIAIIMDGNGRWAKKRALPRSAGHAAGSENFRNIATYCNDIGIKYLTVYAFSTENWKRPEDEVKVIMDLFRKYLFEALEKIRKDNIVLRFFGERSNINPDLLELMERAEAESIGMTGINVNICLNYGGRNEIAFAAKKIAEDAKTGKILTDSIDEELFSNYLYSAGMPDPDLIIRPSGEYRISNFLLWQSAYSEYYFTNVFWPDFDRHELNKAIIEYQHRSRRFGGL